MTEPSDVPNGPPPDDERARRLVDLPPSGPAASRPIAAAPVGQRERRTRRERAMRLGRYESASTASMTRARTAALTCGLPARVRDTVAADTPARRATSPMRLGLPPHFSFI